MYDMTRTPSIAAALVLLLSAPFASAIDNAPVNALSSTAVMRPALPAGAAALKVDDYKETDVWGRIRSGYAIPDISNNLVERHTRSYSLKPDYMARISGRASPYLYHVVQELEKRGMPTELALLPVIESAFNPQALSTANAAGIWQFVPGTGKDFNLKQNTFKDERRGVLASTDAALTYLQRLYAMFGDWQLALAAYNWGEGNVQKAIKKNQALGKPTDFESLADLMPAETRNYVPKLQAVKNIVGNPGQYNVTLPVIDNQPYFTAVDKTSDIDLAIAAQLAEMSVDEFKALNPQFKRPVITGDDRTKILLPQKNAEKFQLNLAQFGQALSTWTTHKITGAKESIASLASKFGTTPEIIRQANNIPAQTRLKAGSTILVPKTSASLHSDIAENIVDSAVMALEADRGEKRGGARTQRFKTKAVANSGKRILRGTSSTRKHR
ncbi:transglycosylase SLT domain-containing protein [Massilia jejuensis]|uniref:Transglycosylase SLT domain-containing protein n=2 Tax=Massilia jejuensis TaxID=648894 RepID=A0ABW0PGZ3_9BURK